MLLRMLAVGSVSLAAMIGGAAALAQEYPSKTVRVIVANSVGSLADIVARVIFNKAGELLGQPFVIDNRPGAGGSIAGEAGAKAAADGYTLLFASDSVMAIAPHVYPSLPYDPLRDFSAVSMVAKIPAAFVAHPSLGAKSLEDFLRLARAQPGKFNYGSGGVGHATHMGMEMLLIKAGVQLVHVPYKGTGPLTQALLTGEVSAANIGLGLVLSHIQDGRLVGLAISGPRNQGTLPGVPDVGKIVPGSEFISWQALFAPARTPQAVIDKLNAVILRVVAAPEIRTRMQETGMATVTSTPAEMTKTVADDLANYRDLVRRLGLKPN
ncbi:MAG: Bug family tripartite tricarboxylate transporter substrate binding protein [Burkholderiales bacterium]